MFFLKIETGKDAFAEAPERVIADMLRSIAAQLDGGKMADRIHDANGNNVGRYRLLTPDEEQARCDAIDQARSEYGSDEIQIDDDADTSRADDGTWVQGWLWIADPETEGDEDDDDDDGHIEDDINKLNLAPFDGLNAAEYNAVEWGGVCPVQDCPPGIDVFFDDVCYEHCDDADAIMWMVYLHLKEGGCQAIHDVSTAEEARATAEAIGAKYGWKVLKR